jgi:DNA-binding response OmpR family regulator
MNHRTLLIVESNPQISQKLKDNFQKDNFIVYTAAGYQDAIDTVQNQKPSLIISEVLLTDGDGIQLCKTLKEDNQSWFIPFIFLTSANDTLIEIK